jgi:hypothetical protein
VSNFDSVSSKMPLHALPHVNEPAIKSNEEVPV